MKQIYWALEIDGIVSGVVLYLTKEAADKEALFYDPMRVKVVEVNYKGVPF